MTVNDEESLHTITARLEKMPELLRREDWNNKLRRPLNKHTALGRTCLSEKLTQAWTWTDDPDTQELDLIKRTQEFLEANSEALTQHQEEGQDTQEDQDAETPELNRETVEAGGATDPVPRQLDALSEDQVHPGGITIVPFAHRVERMSCVEALQELIEVYKTQKIIPTSVWHTIEEVDLYECTAAGEVFSCGSNNHRNILLPLGLARKAIRLNGGIDLEEYLLIQPCVVEDEDKEKSSNEIQLLLEHCTKAGDYVDLKISVRVRPGNGCESSSVYAMKHQAYLNIQCHRVLGGECTGTVACLRTHEDYKEDSDHYNSLCGYQYLKDAIVNEDNEHRLLGFDNEPGFKVIEDIKAIELSQGKMATLMYMQYWGERIQIPQKDRWNKTYTVTAWQMATMIGADMTRILRMESMMDDPVYRQTPDPNLQLTPYPNWDEAIDYAMSIVQAVSEQMFRYRDTPLYAAVWKEAGATNVVKYMPTLAHALRTGHAAHLETDLKDYIAKVREAKKQSILDVPLMEFWIREWVETPRNRQNLRDIELYELHRLYQTYIRDNPGTFPIPKNNPVTGEHHPTHLRTKRTKRKRKRG